MLSVSEKRQTSYSLGSVHNNEFGYNVQYLSRSAGKHLCGFPDQKWRKEVQENQTESDSREQNGQ